MRLPPARLLVRAWALSALTFGLVSCATASDAVYSPAYEGVAVAEASADRGFFDVFGGGDDGAAKSAEAPMAMAPPPPPPPAEQAPSTTEPEVPGADEGKPVEASKRLVIYTGNMSLMVVDADTALSAFVDDVVKGGGYLQTRSATTVTVRVPAAQFFTTLEQLRQRGTVLDENINAQDVTKQVFDIELRLQTAEESRKRLVVLLQAATKIEDILRIETELRRLTQEIEGMKAQLRTLGDQVAFSTLTVSFSANAPAPRRYPERTRSRFEWINQIGVERVLGGF